MQHPPVDRQPPTGHGLDLVDDSDVGVQIGVPGSAVAVGERGGDQSGDVYLTYPCRTLPAEQRMVLQPVQRIGDRGLVRCFDPGRHVRRSEGPQGGDGLDGGEGEVVPPDRRRRRSRPPGHRRSQLQVTLRVPPLSLAEPLEGQVGADSSPHLGRQSGPGREAEALSVRGVAGPQLLAERPLHPLHRAERHPQQHRSTASRRCLAGEGMAALGEQQPHLLPSHHITDLEAIDPGDAAAHPASWRLTPLGVVGRQIRATPVGRV